MLTSAEWAIPLSQITRPSLPPPLPITASAALAVRGGDAEARFQPQDLTTLATAPGIPYVVDNGYFFIFLGNWV